MCCNAFGITTHLLLAPNSKITLIDDLGFCTFSTFMLSAKVDSPQTGLSIQRWATPNLEAIVLSRLYSVLTWVLDSPVYGEVLDHARLGIYNPFILAHLPCVTSVDLSVLTSCHWSTGNGEPLIVTMFAIDSPAAVTTPSFCLLHSYVLHLCLLQFKDKSWFIPNQCPFL